MGADVKESMDTPRWYQPMVSLLAHLLGAFRATSLSSRVRTSGESLHLHVARSRQLLETAVDYTQISEGLVSESTSSHALRPPVFLRKAEEEVLEGHGCPPDADRSLDNRTGEQIPTSTCVPTASVEEQLDCLH